MFEKAIKIINESNKIYIISHKNPDGDAIGSTFGLYFALKNINKNAKVLMPICADSFNFLPGIDEAVEKVEEDKFDLLIALDSSDKSRLAISEEDFAKAKKVIVIDHHKEAIKYGDISCIDSEMPATCELIYYFLKELGIKLNENIAKYLYTGIMTDTGNFSYSSTRPSTLIVASELIKLDIKFSDICKRLNDTIKEAKLKLIARTIDNMEVFFDGKVRYSYIKYELIESLGLNDEESEGMTNYLRMIENTDVAIYVRERKDGTNKVSLRASENLDVGEIALKFGGGGHKRAAGYTMTESYEIEKEKLINLLGGILNVNS